MSITVRIIRDGDEAPNEAEEDFSVDLQALLERDLGPLDEEVEAEADEYQPLDEAYLYGPKRPRMKATNPDYASRIADAYDGVFTVQDVNRAMSVFTEVIIRAFSEDKVVFLKGFGHFYSRPYLLDGESLKAFKKNMIGHQANANIGKYKDPITNQFHFRPTNGLRAAATEAGRKRLIDDAAMRLTGPSEHRIDPSADGEGSSSGHKKSGYSRRAPSSKR